MAIDRAHRSADRRLSASLAACLSLMATVAFAKAPLRLSCTGHLTCDVKSANGEMHPCPPSEVHQDVTVNLGAKTVDVDLHLPTLTVTESSKAVIVARYANGAQFGMFTLNRIEGAFTYAGVHARGDDLYRVREEGTCKPGR